MKDLINCPNCGAPITHNKCEYCGTVFGNVEADKRLDEIKYELETAKLNLSQAAQGQFLLGLITTFRAF